MNKGKYSPAGWLTAWFDHVPQGAALDLGAGAGDLSVWLADRDFQVTAVERDEEILSQLQARSRISGFAVVEQDLADYEPAPAHFSLVVAASVLHFLLPQKLPGLAHRLTEGLAPGGFLMAEVFTVDDPSYSERQARNSQIAADTFSLPDRSETIHYFQKGELRELFAELQILSYQEDRRLDQAGEYGYRAGATLVARRWNH